MHLLRLRIYFNIEQFSPFVTSLHAVVSYLMNWGTPKLVYAVIFDKFNLLDTPSLRMLTINFDGAAMAQKATGGLIIRNHEGSMCWKVMSTLTYTRKKKLKK